MTIKVTRDVNLDEKSIHIENDKLTVNVSNNPDNKLVKTENGLEVLINTSTSNSLNLTEFNKEVFTSKYPDIFFDDNVIYITSDKKLVKGIKGIISEDVKVQVSMKVLKENTRSLSKDDFLAEFNNGDTLKYKDRNANLDVDNFLVSDVTLKISVPNDSFLTEELIKSKLDLNMFFNKDSYFNEGLFRTNYYEETYPSESSKYIGYMSHEVTSSIQDETRTVNIKFNGYVENYYTGSVAEDIETNNEKELINFPKIITNGLQHYEELADYQKIGGISISKITNYNLVLKNGNSTHITEVYASL